MSPKIKATTRSFHQSPAGKVRAAGKVTFERTDRDPERHGVDDDPDSEWPHVGDLPRDYRLPRPPCTSQELGRFPGSFYGDGRAADAARPGLTATARVLISGANVDARRGLWLSDGAQERCRAPDHGRLSARSCRRSGGEAGLGLAEGPPSARRVAGWPCSALQLPPEVQRRPATPTPPTILPTKIDEGHGPGLTCRIEGELVPVLHVRTDGGMPIFIEHHLVIVTDAECTILLQPSAQSARLQTGEDRQPDGDRVIHAGRGRLVNIVVRGSATGRRLTASTLSTRSPAGRRCRAPAKTRRPDRLSSIRI